MTPTKLTPLQKLHAFQHRFYDHQVWKPKAGDYYTTTRADMELYMVVAVENGLVHTTYLPEGGEISVWNEDGFTSKEFGLCRLHVPDFILEMKE